MRDANTIIATIDCVASLLFASWGWFYARVLLPTYMRPYPGTTVALPNGSGSIFVRDPQHMLELVPDAKSAVGGLYLRNLVLVHVGLISLLAHLTRREAHIAMPMICWAIGLTELVTNPAKCYVGRLRPQFYAACGWDEALQDCTWDPSITGDPHFTPPDARHSFPSEHSSLAMCVGLLLSLYALRALPDAPPP